MNQEKMATQFEVAWCGQVYLVTIDRQKLGAMCAKASRNKSLRARDGALCVNDLKKKDPNL